MKHGSLFSGGGGFDLAAEKMGWENVFHCEKDAFCQTILKHYWPHAETFTDIKEFNSGKFKGAIDIITGGFPCQPFSAAGKRQGTADDHYLWPDMLRVIKTIRPRWVVCENVYGLINWNGGLVFDTVQSDLEAQGYEIAAFVLPAAGVNAPHQRYRVWVVGHLSQHTTKRKAKADPDTNGIRRDKLGLCGKTAAKGKPGNSRDFDILCPAQSSQIIADPGCQRLQYKTGIGKLARGRPVVKNTGDRWQDWPTQSPLCGGNDGLPDRLDNITFPKWCAQSIKLFGNAIVPDVAVQLFRSIERYEQLHR